MVRLLLLALLAMLGQALSCPSARAQDDLGFSKLEPQALAEKLNPDLMALNPDGTPKYPMRNAFGSPGSDISEQVAANNWFNLLVYMPFLIAPQILLVIVIFRFRERGDGRKPATFMTNHKLEFIWTAIPILALVVVSVPVGKLLYHMELAPANIDTNDPDKATVITITGHQFAWDYEYQAEKIKVGVDIRQGQEPMIMVKDRPVLLNITSTDVNHAWWLPAMGVKKSAIRGRFTNCWFTPTVLGEYKGNCVELCGQGHGTMFITGLVVSPAEFEQWKILQRDRLDAQAVWDILQPAGDAQPASDADLKAAVAKYLGGHPSDERRYALRYWVAANYLALHRCWGYQAMADDLAKHEDERKKDVDTLVASIAASTSAMASR